MKAKNWKKKKKEKTSFQNVPPVEIYIDGPEFNPVAEDGVTWVMANVPVSISGNRQTSLSHRNSAFIDCGFTVKVPKNYRLIIELSPDFKDHGLEIYKNVIIGENRVGINVRNLGREIVVINHRDRIASLRIEPIYNLTLKIKG